MKSTPGHPATNASPTTAGTNQCAPRATGLVAPLEIDGTLNSEQFRVYVEQQLVKVLTAGDIVVLDNLRATRSPAYARRSRV